MVFLFSGTEMIIIGTTTIPGGEVAAGVWIGMTVTDIVGRREITTIEAGVAVLVLIMTEVVGKGDMMMIRAGVGVDRLRGLFNTLGLCFKQSFGWQKIMRKEKKMRLTLHIWMNKSPREMMNSLSPLCFPPVLTKMVILDEKLQSFLSSCTFSPGTIQRGFNVLCFFCCEL